jgi:large subunit ribosomal protein L18
MKTKNEKRLKRKAHIKKILGNSKKPRLCVFKSLNNIYAQVFSFENGKVLVSVSTISQNIKNEIKGHKGNINAAKKVGEKIAVLCKEKDITEVAFDRNGYIYHGRVKALADAARENGLNF